MLLSFIRPMADCSLGMAVKLSDCHGLLEGTTCRLLVRDGCHGVMDYWKAQLADSLSVSDNVTAFFVGLGTRWLCACKFLT